MSSDNSLLDTSDATIEDAVKYADPIVLRALLYQLTGDEAVAATKTESITFGFLEAQEVIDEAEIALLHEKAIEFLKAHRDAGEPAIGIGPRDRLSRSVSLCAGVDLPDSEIELWIESLALDPFARGLTWHDKPQAERIADFPVLVIGAGMGGLNAAVLLKQAGIPFTVLEKDNGVGGTWNQNRYPGLRVDTPSRGYVHMYGVDYDHLNPFCPGGHNEKYFNWVADNFDVRSSIQFGTEVRRLAWDEQAQFWLIEADGPEGPQTFTARAVISCVGFLSRANVPQIEGSEDFRGTAFHTSAWPADFDVEGKRVAVVGTGASGYQLVPELAKLAEHTYLFQRTPNWCFNVDGYLAPYPEQVRWLDKHLPWHCHFMRLRACYLYGPDNLGTAFTADPDFEDPHARSALNKRIREGCVEFISSKLAGRPELIEAMIPAAPPMSSRPILIDTDYSIYDALLREDVTLVTGGVSRIVENGIVSPDGQTHEVDVIAFATGFRANDFLWPMQVEGRGGVDVGKLWERDGGRAYLGVLLPGFPNLFTIYGPNTSPTGGLNVVDLEELQTRFALECIRGLIEQGRSSVDVSEAAFDRYNEEVDRCEKHRIYMDPRAKNYYTNDFGRSAVNSPIDARVMWDWLRSPVEPLPNVGEHAGLRPFFGEDLIVT
ncbi:NAD(P)/FAD-dependent oxidoreductase [Jatrophihabitans sp.]|uniref:flavin-containing monooxygenase n=1 Tax=Jatrophihabitans sp. TaxID=1932789 RepID=UPI0030C77D83|nr:Flavin-containing monooxygenase-like protein [Jatrophihabitans sp.]